MKTHDYCNRYYNVKKYLDGKHKNYDLIDATGEDIIFFFFFVPDFEKKFKKEIFRKSHRMTEKAADYVLDWLIEAHNYCENI